MYDKESWSANGFASYIQTHSFTGNPPKTGLLKFEKVDGSTAFIILFFDITENAVSCTQRIKIIVKDCANSYSNVFKVQIVPEIF